LKTEYDGQLQVVVAARKGRGAISGLGMGGDERKRIQQL